MYSYFYFIYGILQGVPKKLSLTTMIQVVSEIFFWELSQACQKNKTKSLQMRQGQHGDVVSVCILIIFCWLSLGHLLVIFWPSLDHLQAICRSSVSLLQVIYQSSVSLLQVFLRSFASLTPVFCLSSVGLLLVFYWSSIGLVLVFCRSNCKDFKILKIDQFQIVGLKNLTQVRLRNAIASKNS